MFSVARKLGARVLVAVIVLAIIKSATGGQFDTGSIWTALSQASETVRSVTAEIPISDPAPGKVSNKGSGDDKKHHPKPGKSGKPNPAEN